MQTIMPVSQIYLGIWDFAIAFLGNVVYNVGNCGEKWVKVGRIELHKRDFYLVGGELILQCFLDNTPILWMIKVA